MTLGDRQRAFVPMVAKLIEWAYANGYELTFSEAWRSQEEAALNAQKGTGVVNSLHCLRLAVDLNLFRDKVLLQGLEDYRPLGDYWKSLGGSWGGDFHRPDADHFSLDWQGIR